MSDELHLDAWAKEVPELPELSEDDTHVGARVRNRLAEFSVRFSRPYTVSAPYLLDNDRAGEQDSGFADSQQFVGLRSAQMQSFTEVIIQPGSAAIGPQPVEGEEDEPEADDAMTAHQPLTLAPLQEGQLPSSALRRARSVVRALHDEHGISDDRLTEAVESATALLLQDDATAAADGQSNAAAVTRICDLIRRWRRSKSGARLNSPERQAIIGLLREIHANVTNDGDESAEGFSPVIRTAQLFRWCGRFIGLWPQKLGAMRERGRSTSDLENLISELGEDRVPIP